MRNEYADLILDTVAPDQSARMILAVTDGRIAAVGGDEPERFLHRWRGTGTQLRSFSGYVFPAFVDTHNHLMLTAANELGVPMRGVRSIADVLQRIVDRVAQTPAGEWVVTAADWHEMQLSEQRLPTAAELDAISTTHPILVLRGGHNGSANTFALTVAGIDAGSADIDNGVIARTDAGVPLGPVQDEALVAVQRFVPAPSEEDLVGGIDTVSARYRAHGIGTVRDAAVSVTDWAALLEAHRQHRLHVRTHAMIFSPGSAINAAGGIAAYLDQLERLGIVPGAGDDVVQLWGLKLVLDGGVEAAALAEPYTDRPESTGTLLSDLATLTEILTTCADRGWSVGAHAMGERAIGLFLDAAATAQHARTSGTAAQLVLEHAALITSTQREQAKNLGVRITAQQALRDGLLGPFLNAFGTDRVARMFPWRSLHNAGVHVSAGTDHPIGPLHPVNGIVAMTTRDTPFGLLGADEAIDRSTALQLYTRAGGELLPGSSAGRIEVGARADVSIWPSDLLTATTAELIDIMPTASFIGGLDIADR